MGDPTTVDETARAKIRALETEIAGLREKIKNLTEMVKELVNHDVEVHAVLRGRRLV